ncbi:MAG TPA: hypothetical protein EYP55_09535 [Anaerolineae bacterium]|nr:hypothetical protein [Anaerolineae bacterium]
MLERLLRDARLMIWTGINEIMDLLIQHEDPKGVVGGKVPGSGQGGRCIRGGRKEKGYDEHALR